jgi:hypothetical protein
VYPAWFFREFALLSTDEDFLPLFTAILSIRLMELQEAESNLESSSAR